MPVERARGAARVWFLSGVLALLAASAAHGQSIMTIRPTLVANTANQTAYLSYDFQTVCSFVDSIQSSVAYCTYINVMDVTADGRIVWPTVSVPIPFEGFQQQLGWMVNGANPNYAFTVNTTGLQAGTVYNHYAVITAFGPEGTTPAVYSRSEEHTSELQS